MTVHKGYPFTPLPFKKAAKTMVIFSLQKKFLSKKLKRSVDKIQSVLELYFRFNFKSIYLNTVPLGCDTVTPVPPLKYAS